MKWTAVALLLATSGLPLAAANAAANSEADRIDTPLEYYFGGLALAALVITWLWLWLKVRGRVQAVAPSEDAAPDKNPGKNPDKNEDKSEEAK